MKVFSVVVGLLAKEAASAESGRCPSCNLKCDEQTRVEVGGCFDDLEKLAKDMGTVGTSVKNLAKDCHGEDRSQCQADVDFLLGSLEDMQTVISSATTTCGDHSPQCVAEIKKLGVDIQAIDGPARNMADECAGKDKSIISCISDGLKVGSDVVAVGKEVETVYSTCKTGTVAKPPGSSPNCGCVFIHDEETCNSSPDHCHWCDLLNLCFDNCANRTAGSDLIV